MLPYLFFWRTYPEFMGNVYARRAHTYTRIVIYRLFFSSTSFPLYHFLNSPRYTGRERNPETVRCWVHPKVVWPPLPHRQKKKKVCCRGAWTTYSDPLLTKDACHYARQTPWNTDATAQQQPPTFALIHRCTYNLRQNMHHTVCCYCAFLVRVRISGCDWTAKHEPRCPACSATCAANEKHRSLAWRGARLDHRLTRLVTHYNSS